jgi:UPF0716 protein FxsA
MITLGRRARMILTAVFVLLPMLELVLLVVIGQQLGALPVIGYVIVLGLLGAWLIRRRWRSAWESLQQARTGDMTQMPGGSLTGGLDTAIYVAGCLALIFPGVITDVIGLVCLLPFTRSLPRRLLIGMLDRSMPGFSDLLRMEPTSGPRRPGAYGDVIEGEVVDEPAAGTSQPDSDQVIIRGEIDHGPDQRTNGPGR